MAKRRKRKEVRPRLNCIFCDEIRKMSREHVWGDWTGEVLPTKSKHRAKQTVFFGGRAQAKTEQGDESSRRLKVACTVCNGTWMSRIEQRTIPVATPLILGQTVELTPDAQITLATWFALKTMVWEFAFPHSITASDYTRRRFMEAGRPDSEDWQIWLGYSDLPDYKGYRSAAIEVLHESQLGVIETPKPTNIGKSAVLVFGRMVAFAVFAEVPFLRGFQLPPEFEPKLTKIWPASRGRRAGVFRGWIRPTRQPLTWPSTAPLTAGDFNALPNAHETWASRIRVTLPDGTFMTDLLRR